MIIIYTAGWLLLFALAVKLTSESFLHVVSCSRTGENFDVIAAFFAVMLITFSMPIWYLVFVYAPWYTTVIKG